MSRDDGFAVADLSVHLYDDDKVKRLYRELGGDLGRMGHAMMLCEATLLASWRDGRRRTVHEAAPLWLTVDDELVSVLVRVGLLDRTCKRPIRSWNAWFGPAFERREKRRKSGALGGRPPRNQPAEHEKPFANHPDNSRKPRPSDRPSGPSVRSARARETTPSNDGGRNGRVGTLAETMAAMGLAVKP
jgi:hypothetical protein